MKFRIILLLIIICSINHCIKAEIDTQHIPFNVSARNQGFIENKGQITDEEGNQLNEVLYEAHIELGIVHVLKDKIRFHIRKNLDSIKNQHKNSMSEVYHTVEMYLDGANQTVRVQAFDKMEGTLHYYTNKSNKGVQSVNRWKKVLISDVYDNIDLLV